MRKKDLNRIITKLELAVEGQQWTMSNLAGADHPQHRATFERASGRKDGFEAVLEALRGFEGYLDIWADHNKENT